MKNDSRNSVSETPLSVVLLLALALAACAGSAHAADLQAKTVDGQVIQGEYLGTENNIVRIKTTYGVVAIPSQNIVTLLAISLPGKTETAPGAPATEPIAELPVFKEPKNVNLSSMLAARMPRIPDAGVKDRIELFRLVRNFGDSSDASRNRIIHTLAGFGLMAYPYIDGSYNQPYELDDKVEMLKAVTGPHRPYSAQILSTVHATALAEMGRTATTAPQLPSEVITQRSNIMTREQRLRLNALNIRIIEGYASASGGPFNALFLFSVYRSRYGGDADPLLKDSTTDRLRLAQTAADYKNSNSGWTPDDRVLMIELAFPMYFKDNDDLKPMAQDFLKNLLPEKHPKWDAPQSDWVEWWTKQRHEILKGK